ncbi:hypothetical protein D3C75_670540 [compost metagenome]
MLKMQMKLNRSDLMSGMLKKIMAMAQFLIPLVMKQNLQQRQIQYQQQHKVLSSKILMLFSKKVIVLVMPILMQHPKLVQME